jgi:hypothetical protein
MVCSIHIYTEYIEPASTMAKAASDAVNATPPPPGMRYQGPTSAKSTLAEGCQSTQCPCLGTPPGMRHCHKLSACTCTCHPAGWVGSYKQIDSVPIGEK